MTVTAVVCPHCFTKNRVPESRLAEAPKCGSCHELLFTGKPLPVNGAQLRKMVNGNDIPVIVDCWATWCGPCQMFAPVFAEAAAQLEPHARLLKLDTEQNSETATRLAIRSIPTLLMFEGGRETQRQAGAMPLAHFMNWATQTA